MAFTIPTTKELKAQFLAALESRLNQTTPPIARAFNKVLSASLAMLGTGVYKYIADRALQALALTATLTGLDKQGSNYGVYRIAAAAAVLEIKTAGGTPGTTIPAGTAWTADSTNEIYTTVAEVTIDGAGDGLMNAIASSTGEEGNLALAETFTIQTPIAGVATTAEVVADVTTDGIVTEGRSRETDAAYRRRVLTRIRAAGGGGNYADYREWGEEVDDAARVFPYSGKPITFYASDDFTITDDGAGGAPYTITYSGGGIFDFEDLGFHVGGLVTITGSTTAANNATWEILTVAAGAITVDGPLTPVASETITLVNESLPGDRCVYVESVSVPAACPSATLDEVREHLLADPDTGIARMPLGLVDERLYMESVYRPEIVIDIVGLDVAVEIEAETKTKITTALDDYVERVCCYVSGLDFPGDRTDVVSTVTLSTVVQGILRGVGGSAESVNFTIDAVAYDVYQLSQGELLTHAVASPTWS